MGFRHHHCKITKIHICQQQSRSLSIQSIHLYNLYIQNFEFFRFALNTLNRFQFKDSPKTFQNHILHFPFIEISSVRFFRFFYHSSYFVSFVIKKERVYIAIENENEVVLTLFYFISKAIWETKSVLKFIKSKKTHFTSLDSFVSSLLSQFIFVSNKKRKGLYRDRKRKRSSTHLIFLLYFESDLRKKICPEIHKI